jgi:hypothetical protein
MQRAEQLRRARLTADQRAVEDAQRTARASQAAKAKLGAKTAKAADPYRNHASFTLLEWACLLRARNPEEFSEWFADFSGENDKILQLVKVLHASVRLTTAHSDVVPLAPVNPAAPSKEWRFPQAELMRVSLTKKLGYAIQLEAVFGSPPSLSAVEVAKAAEGLASSRLTSNTTRTKPVKVLRQSRRVVKVIPEWQTDADAFISKVDRRIEQRAADTGKSADELRAALLKGASMGALFAEWALAIPGGKAPVSKKHFAEYVNKAHDWLQFPAGSRGKGHTDRKVLARLLEGEDESLSLPTKG